MAARDHVWCNSMWLHELEEIYTCTGTAEQGSCRRASGSWAACCRLEVRSCSEEVLLHVVYIQAAAGSERERWHEGLGGKMSGSKQDSTVMRRVITGVNQYCPVTTAIETAGRVTCVLEQDMG